MAGKRQLRLFAAPKIELRSQVRAVEPSEDLVALAKRLPSTLRFGATSWTTPGWDGWVWQRRLPELVLAREGIGAYARHPLLDTVLIDRAARMRPTTDVLTQLAASVPSDFRFVLEADDRPFWGRMPDHPRFGPDAGQPNPIFFDPEAVLERSVVPFTEGLGERGAVLLLRIPGQDPRALGTRRAFPERLHRFLAALPSGPRYAVELRDHKLLTTEYAAALRDCGVLHCLSVHPRMSSLERQLEVVRPFEADRVLLRWSMCPHFDYRAAARNYAPFDAIIDRDPKARQAVLTVLERAIASRIPTMVLVDDMAEGCAPATIQEIAQALAP